MIVPLAIWTVVEFTFVFIFSISSRAVKPAWKTAVSCAATLAASSETLALRWEDIDFEHKEIFFHAKIAEVKKPDGGLKFGYVPFTKTNRREGDHYNPLSFEAEEILKRVADVTGKTEGFVFTGKTGNHLYAQRLREHWKAICDRCGIQYRGIHNQRHYMDTMLKRELGAK